MCSIIGASLGYCNTILYGALMSTTLKLHRMQNSMARVILQQPKPLLLFTGSPFNSGFTTYKLANGYLEIKTRATSTLDYLSDLISARISGPRMLLRSASCTFIAIPSTRTELARWVFSMQAPVVWNSLQESMQSCDCFKTFKTRLNSVFKFPRNQ